MQQIQNMDSKTYKEITDDIFNKWSNDYINMSDEEVANEEAEQEKSRDWEMSQ